MLYKKYKIIPFFLIIIILAFIIIYRFLLYTPPILDFGKRNFVEKTIDFLYFGWHFTKASVYSDYIKNKEKADKELGKAGWYRKKYLIKEFGVNGDNLFSVLGIYERLDLHMIQKKLYVFLTKEKSLEINFLRVAGKKLLIWKNWKIAAEAFSKVIDLNPKDVMAHYCLGLIYLKQKKFIKANQCLESVIELKPDFADAYYQLGIIAEKQKNWQKAQNLYEKSINILPNHLDSLKAIKKINEKLE